MLSEGVVGKQIIMSYEPNQAEIRAERRTAILESLGRKEGDVMEDDKGEYVMVKAFDCEACAEGLPEFEKLYLSDVELN